MESTEKKVELVQLAIQRLMEEKREKKLRSSAEGDDDDDGDGHRLLLRQLLSELETLEGDDGKAQQQHKAPGNQKGPRHCPAVVGGDTESKAANEEVEGGGSEEIVKELREIKRQNFITHCLLSAMIALTLVWQLSEVSLVLKLKDGLNHPVRSLGGMLAGILKRSIENGQNGDEEKEPADKQHHNGGPTLPPLRIPEITHLELPLDLDKED